MLARVYPAVAQLLPASAEPSARLEEQALNTAPGLAPAGRHLPVPSAERLDLVKEGFASLDVEDCYSILVNALSVRDWDLCRAAVGALAAYESEGTEPWNAEINPGYEPVPSALVAVARERGFPLETLDTRAREWLWPAVESQPGLVPAQWPPAAR